MNGEQHLDHLIHCGNNKRLSFALALHSSLRYFEEYIENSHAFASFSVSTCIRISGLKLKKLTEVKK